MNLFLIFKMKLKLLSILLVTVFYVNAYKEITGRDKCITSIDCKSPFKCKLITTRCTQTVIKGGLRWNCIEQGYCTDKKYIEKEEEV